MTLQDDLPGLMREAAAGITADSDRMVDRALGLGRRKQGLASAARVGIAGVATLAVVAGAMLGPRMLGSDRAPAPGAGPAVVSIAPPVIDGPLGGVAPADPSTVSIAVLNATSSPQLARQTATALTAEGFSIDSIGNVDACAALDSCEDQTPTTIDYRPGQEAAARAVLDRYPGAAPRLSPGVAVVTLTLGTIGATPRSR